MRGICLCLIFAVACRGDDQVTPEPVIGADVLGNLTHTLDSVRLDLIGSSADGLDIPRDLDFNPERPGELWVVNKADDSVSIFFDAGTAEQRSEHLIDPFAMHFMEQVSSISFGAPVTFGTCQESRNTYDGTEPYNDFMGPTLWSSDLDVFAHSNLVASQTLSQQYGMPVDLGSHLDMLHESPWCMGIVWEKDNVYWVFDGLAGSIVRYDFQHDHGPGWDDHSDGVIARYGQRIVKRVADVPSHLELDHADGLLYIADTGNNRISVLDTTAGARGRDLVPTEPGTDYYLMDGVEQWDLVLGAEIDPPMEAPSGIALVDDVLFVTDNATSRIYAFTLDGELLDYLDTELPAGSLMGVEAASLEELWLVDAVGNQVLRLRP